MTHDVVDGMKWYLAFLASTTLHEAAHAWTALRLGDDTAYRGGQVTLDPTPHVRREPIGMVVVPILSYFLGGWMIGWASAPYDPQWAARHPKRSAVMSLAGPAANLLLLLLSGLAIRIGIAAGTFAAPERIDALHVTVATGEGFSTFIAAMVSVFFSLNLLLFVFNLLPVPPMDGSGIALFFVNERSAGSYLSMMRRPMVSYAGLVIAWRAFDVIYRPIQLFVLNVLYPGSGYH